MIYYNRSKSVKNENVFATRAHGRKNNTNNLFSTHLENTEHNNCKKCGARLSNKRPRVVRFITAYLRRKKIEKSFFRNRYTYFFPRRRERYRRLEEAEGFSTFWRFCEFRRKSSKNIFRTWNRLDFKRLGFRFSIRFSVLSGSGNRFYKSFYVLNGMGVVVLKTGFII